MTSRSSPRPKPHLDHRVRVARARRENTQARIVRSALRVFAERGPDAPVIEDFVRAAGIARGTFYNYYQSTTELLEAATALLEDELISAIEARMATLTDPLERLATGITLWLRRAEADRLWCRFVVRVRRRGAAVEARLGEDLRAGVQQGLFRLESFEAGRDMVVGTLLEAMNRLAAGEAAPGYTLAVARTVLRGLGVGKQQSEAVLARTAERLAPADGASG